MPEEALTSLTVSDAYSQLLTWSRLGYSALSTVSFQFKPRVTFLNTVDIVLLEDSLFYLLFCSLFIIVPFAIFLLP